MQVITAQYFVWFFCLFPLILPWSRMKLMWKGLTCIVVWTTAQLHWLIWAYALEFQGKNVFLGLWIASISFFAANIFVLSMLIWYHTYTPYSHSYKVYEENAIQKGRKQYWGVFFYCGAFLLVGNGCHLVGSDYKISSESMVIWVDNSFIWWGKH